MECKFKGKERLWNRDLFATLNFRAISHGHRDGHGRPTTSDAGRKCLINCRFQSLDSERDIMVALRKDSWFSVNSALGKHLVDDFILQLSYH